MGISSGAAASPRTSDGMQAVGPGQMPDRVGQGPILSRMNIKRIAIATFLLSLLAACGNKGPLVMPDPPADLPAAPADAPAPATTPEGASGTPAPRR